MSVEIYKIEDGSIAEEIGLVCGDKILSINGENFSDALEYRFLISEEYIELEIEDSNGEITLYEIEKEEYEDLGIEFLNPLIDKPRSCRNNCIFCFIDQLPKGLRKPLYFKDDDTRLSFLNGNYVTLTNIDEKEIDKIIRIRLSPINISVHTTDDELRKFMLNNRFAGGILEKIKKLTDNKITVNCQIVLVKGVNDGENLIKTINDLSAFYPYMHSVSVVPVGISDHREGLYEIDPFSREDAKKIVDDVTLLQEKFLKEKGSRIVYIADELYILSGYPMPEASVYEDFPQIENGVGMLASFIEEVNETIEMVENKSVNKTVVVGELVYPYFKQIAEIISKKTPDVEVKVISVKNKLFGKRITVSGLLCGRDIVDALNNIQLGDSVLLSENMLRAEKDVFLDDMTIEEVEKKLGKKVIFVADNGKDFIDKIYN